MSNGTKEEIVNDTLAIAGRLRLSNEAALGQIAAALIISHGMQTVSDIGPALNKMNDIFDNWVNTLRS